MIDAADAINIKLGAQARAQQMLQEIAGEYIRPLVQMKLAIAAQSMPPGAWDVMDQMYPGEREQIFKMFAGRPAGGG